jgi:peroxiredoxin family protein
MTDGLSMVLFSGTTDKLHAAATIVAGAAAMGRPVNVLLQYWGLDAFRADRIDSDHGLAFDAMTPGSSRLVAGAADIPWLETFRMAKELGDVTIQACSGSLETLGFKADRLDELVDGPCGIATFLTAAEGGQILFI